MSKDLENVDALIKTMADQIVRLFKESHRKDPVIIGIHTGGIWIAERLSKALEIDAPLGHLNIAFYRDDFRGYGSRFIWKRRKWLLCRRCLFYGTMS